MNGVSEIKIFTVGIVIKVQKFFLLFQNHSTSFKVKTSNLTFVKLSSYLTYFLKRILINNS